MAIRTVTMSHEELDRFGVISRVRERRLTQVEASRILNMGVRKVFDRLSQIRQTDIVDGKCLGSVLTMAREAQLASGERRSKSCPSRPFPGAGNMQ